METTNPEQCAVNEVRREAEEVGVLRAYIEECVAQEHKRGFATITWRKALLQVLKEEKEATDGK